MAAPNRPVALVALEMGYGHLRAAWPLADRLGTTVLDAAQPPLAPANEQRNWRRTRAAYDVISRTSQIPLFGHGPRRVLEALTAIPHLHQRADQSASTVAVGLLDALARRGHLGEGLLAYLRAHDATLVTTFYAPAVVADAAGWARIVCVVTDTDLNRIWVPRNPRASGIIYCAPSERAARRLRAYGVAPARIHFTGFPLPAELSSEEHDEALRAALAARIVRLDPSGTFRSVYGQELRRMLGPLPNEAVPGSPLVTFAVGGAGAQAGVPEHFLPSLAQPIRDGRVRLALVTGVRNDIACRYREMLERHGLADLEDGAVEVLCADGFETYYRGFNALLARTDVLWTKPSELTFYGALGIPLVFAPPVGVHERLNRRWAIQRGAGLKQDAPEWAWRWLAEMLEDGTLAGAAWAGFLRLPRRGTERVARVVAAVGAGEPIHVSQVRESS
jgi:hypothetical protein